MLVELAVVEQRYRAVLEVLEGASVVEVACRFGVARQTVHAWLRRYAADGGMAGLADRSSRPSRCPHQIPAAIESRVLELRLAHPGWGPDRIRFQLQVEDRTPLPGRSSVYRALLRAGLIQPGGRRRRRSDYRRWERARPMQLWQMDVMGSVFLADGSEVKAVTGIDDHARYIVCARLVARATAGPVCAALRHALAVHGVPEEILTDNGKVFTGRFARGGPSRLVAFDRICHENGIRHILTAPYSPTTTGKVERLHKSMRAEVFRLHEREWAGIEQAQAALDAWVEEYNTARPHRALGGRPPVERFAPALIQAAPSGDDVADAVASAGPEPAAAGALPPAGGVSRWVDQGGVIRLAGHSYRVGRVFAGDQVQVVVSGGLVDIWRSGVLVATHVQRGRRERDRPGPAAASLRAPRQGRARPPTTGPTVTRVVDGSGTVSFAGTGYRVGSAWARKSVTVALVAGSVQITSATGQPIRIHPIRHDRTKEHGAFAVPAGRPRTGKPAHGAAAGVKAKPLPGPAWRPGLDPTPDPDAHAGERETPATSTG